MSQSKFLATLPPEKVEEFKSKYKISDDDLNEILNSATVTPQQSSTAPFDPGLVPEELRGLIGAGQMSVSEVVTLMLVDDYLERKREGKRGGSPSELELDNKRRLDAMEEEKKFEAQLSPLKQDISSLKQTVEKLVENLNKPPTPTAPAESEFAKGLEKTIGDLRSQVTSMEEKFGVRQELTELKNTMNNIQNDFTSFKAAPPSTGTPESPTTTASNLLDSLAGVITKIREVDKQLGGGGTDSWKTATISGGMEVLKEVAKRLPLSGSGEASGSNTPGDVEQTVLNYLAPKLLEKPMEVRSDKIAKELRLPQDKVEQALNSLLAKKLLVLPKGSVTPPETESPQASEAA